MLIRVRALWHKCGDIATFLTTIAGVNLREIQSLSNNNLLKLLYLSENRKLQPASFHKNSDTL